MLIKLACAEIAVLTSPTMRSHKNRLDSSNLFLYFRVGIEGYGRIGIQSFNFHLIENEGIIGDMQNVIYKMMPIILLAFIFTPIFVSAHQPRLVDTDQITVVDPTVSKAYYGTLVGSPHIYTISSTAPFNLYVGILMPYAEDSKKDVRAEIRNGDELIKVIGGTDADWEKMFEFFGQSTYWDGGEYKAQVEPGTYTITVLSTENDSKYSLAIGEIESFDGNETVSAIKIIPELKKDFFDESPISFIKSPFGWGYILIMYGLAFATGFLYRFILKKITTKTVRGLHKNIGTIDRLIRLAIWLGLLLYAISTSWNPWLLFFSGFTFFEAIFSWCGLYAAFGRNTCPIK